MRFVQQNILLRCLTIALRPFVAFCVRHALRLQDLIECAKVVFIEQSMEQARKKSSKPNISRLSLMTGVHRRDVARILRSPEPQSDQRDLIRRIMGQWQSDSRFITATKQPRILDCRGPGSEFFKLVESVSSDVNPATVLFELERCGAIEHTPRGVKLILESYVPSGDIEGGMEILSFDMDDLILGIEENIFNRSQVPNLHARTSYDNVRADALEEIRRWLIKEGHMFHSRAREFISQFDQDINPDPKYNGKKSKVVLGAFSRTEIKPESSEAESKAKRKRGKDE